MAQEDESVWDIRLDSLTVKGHRYTSPLKTKTDGTLVWNMQQMDDLPKLLGNADPIHYAQMLPAVQTNSEYRGGINIEGCDNQHTLVSIGGVPIYNVNHLLGFFSTFNASHYPSMSIARNAVSASSANRLGGQLDMALPADVPDTVSGTLALGLIASQGTLRWPVNDRTALVVSLRCSYINLLYSQWMKADDQQVRYSFYDVNATLTHRLNERNTFLLDFYKGNDTGGFGDEHYLADMKARWGNTMGAAHWLHEGKQQAKTTLYFTSYQNRFSLTMQGMQFALPSGIRDVGLKSDVTWNRLRTGIETIYHDIQPQAFEHSGTFNISDGTVDNVQAFEASLFADYSLPLMTDVTLVGGLRGSLLARKYHADYAIDPLLRLSYDDKTMQLAASYALKHQYMFQLGFSDIGLPTEFWTSAPDNHQPQYAHEFSVSGSRMLFNRRFKVSVDLFYKKLYHQLEYHGSIFDYVNMAYDLNRSMVHGNGQNYGISLMVNKCSGKLTGWISYTNTHARRSFDDLEPRRSYAANHERIHELNTVATYTHNRHWSFGATLVYASGTPFTPVEAMYVLNNNILMAYGEHNAARLRPYMRMDVSANYKWASKGMEHGVNLSCYNVTSRENELFYRLRTYRDGAFAYRPVSFVVRILPSVNYFCKF